MGSSSITVGDVGITQLSDLVADFPFPRTLDRAFPGVPAEAWEPYRPTFPHARYVAHRADWDTVRRAEVQQELAAIAPGSVGQTLLPLTFLGVLDLTDGDRILSREVTALHTPGHTPGSMSLLVTSRGERAILVGDAIGRPAQVEHPDWSVIDDMDGPQAEKTRRQLLDRIEAEGLVFSASHFPDPFFGRLVRLDGRRSWRALAGPASGLSAASAPGRS